MARYYLSEYGFWGGVDPLSDKYPSTSSYAYCNNNPVMLVDPDGRIIEKASRKEWRKLKSHVNSSIRAIKSDLQNLNEVQYQQVSGILKLMYTYLDQLKVLEKSSQVYATNPNSTDNNLKLSDNIIYINYTSLESFVHESVHAYQFEIGNLAFSISENKTYAQDLWDEKNAYLTQFIMCPLSLTSYGVDNYNDITIDWIKGIKTPDGKNLYAPNGPLKTGIFPINVNSLGKDLMKAYPSLDLDKKSQMMPFENLLKGDMYYKK